MTENEEMLNRLVESNRKCLQRLRKDKLATTKLLINIRDLCDYPTAEITQLVKNRINYHLNSTMGEENAKALYQKPEGLSESPDSETKATES